MNAISPQVIKDLGTVWEKVKSRRRDRRDGDRLVDPGRLLGRRRHQGVHPDGRGRRRGADRLRPRAAARHRAAAGCRRSPRSTRSPSAAAASWRWRATSGSRPSRPSSASPRSSSGSSPASAAPSGCRGWSAPSKALEMNLIGDAILADEAEAYGLANRVVPDHELFDDRARLGAQARRPGAARGRADQARLRTRPTSTRGSRHEKAGLRHGLSDRGREGGHRRLPRQAHAEVAGQVEATATGAPSARGADPRRRARSSR